MSESVLLYEYIGSSEAGDATHAADSVHLRYSVVSMMRHKLESCIVLCLLALHE